MGLSDGTFFTTSVTWQRRQLFRSERAAKLFLNTLFSYRDKGIFLLYEFVLMPDHFHLLLAPRPSLALERALQFIKGGFSYRFAKETGSKMEIWERSFTNHRIRDRDDYEKHRRYIHLNPIRAGWLYRLGAIRSVQTVPDFFSTPATGAEAARAGSAIGTA